MTASDNNATTLRRNDCTNNVSGKKGRGANGRTTRRCATTTLSFGNNSVVRHNHGRYTGKTTQYRTDPGREDSTTKSGTRNHGANRDGGRRVKSRSHASAAVVSPLVTSYSELAYTNSAAYSDKKAGTDKKTGMTAS